MKRIIFFIIIAVGSCAYGSMGDEFYLTNKEGQRLGPYPFENHGVLAIEGQSFTILKSNPDEERILKALNSVMIQELEFRQANIRDVADFLFTHMADPDDAQLKGSAASFVVNIGDGNPEAVQEAMDPFSGTEPMRNPEVPLITFSAKNISVLDALNTVCDLTGLTWAIRNRCVMIEKKKQEIETSQAEPNAPVERDAWLWQTVCKLRSIKPHAKLQEAEVRESDDQLPEYGIESEGLIKFAADDWLYIITHSIHSMDDIGDLSIAINARGELFKNKGHVCGGIEFISNLKARPKNSKEFLDSTHSWPTKQTWSPMPYNDPPPLPPKMQSLLDEKRYHALLIQIPEVIKAWAAERDAISRLEGKATHVSTVRKGNPRIITALPDEVARFFDRAHGFYSVSGMKDDDFADLAQLSHLKSIEISNGEIEGSQIEALKPLNDLRNLYLIGCPLKPDAYRQLGTISQLRSLTVNETPLTDSTLQHLHSLTNLTSLWALDTKITLKGAKKFRKACPNTKIRLYPPGHPKKDKELDLNGEKK